MATRMTTTAEDATLEAELDRALAPYADVLPPDTLASFREALADALETHPVGSRLLERVRPAKLVAATEDVAKDGASEAGVAGAKSGTGDAG